MTDDEKQKIVSEMFSNTLVFLDAEMRLQTKTKDTSFEEKIEMRSNSLKIVFLHNIFMLSRFSGTSPQDVLKSFNLESEVNAFSERIKIFTCPDCKEIHA